MLLFSLECQMVKLLILTEQFFKLSTECEIQIICKGNN